MTSGVPGEVVAGVLAVPGGEQQGDIQPQADTDHSMLVNDS